MIKTKHKIASFVITGVLAASLFTGCSSGSTSSDSAQPTKSTQETINLTFWEHTQEYTDASQAVANSFMKTHPNIKIEVENKGDQYDNLLNTSIQAGDAPDIFWTNGNKDNKLSSIVKIGGAMDLTDKIDLSQYDELAKSVLFLKNEKGEKKLYCTPGATIDTRAVFYHKDIFDKYGIKVPNNLAEFEAACETLKKNNITPITLAAKQSWDILFTLEPIIASIAPDWLDDASAGKANINDPRLLKAFNKVEEWINKGYFSQNALGSDTTAALLNFTKQNSAMVINGSWTASTILQNNPDVKLGAFQLPMEKGGKAMVVTYSVGWAGYSKTKHPNEVLQFLQYATTKEAQQTFVKAIGGVPGMKGLQAKDQISQEMGSADKQVDSFYSIIGYRAKDGANPRKLWEDDSIKWMGKALKADDLIKELDQAQDYSKKIDK